MTDWTNENITPDKIREAKATTALKKPTDKISRREKWDIGHRFFDSRGIKHCLSFAAFLILFFALTRCEGVKQQTERYLGLIFQDTTIEETTTDS